MISDKFKNTIWIYYETNLKARTRKEYWNVVKNFDKVVGHDPLELSHTDAYLILYLSNNTATSSGSFS